MRRLTAPDHKWHMFDPDGNPLILDSSVPSLADVADVVGAQLAAALEVGP